MQNPEKAAIVLAAGLGTRMKSDKSKLLHELCGKTFITHIVSKLENLVDEIVVIVGNSKDEVIDEVKKTCPNFIDRITFVDQEEMLGTGHAVKVGLSFLSESIKDVIVVLGDMPLITEQVLSEIFNTYSQSNMHLLVSTALLENPYGYGRILRDENNIVSRIIEEKDCDENLRNINECNMFPFVFKKEFIDFAIDKLDTNNSQGELYLTDIVEIARQSFKGVTSYSYKDIRIAQSANDRYQLSKLEKIMRENINQKHMENGVTIIDPNNTYVDDDVVIENDVTLLPGTYLQGKTVISKGCIIGPNTRIIDSEISENCIIESSKIVESKIGNAATIGPFASLRAGCQLQDNVHVGTSVELKKSTVGKGTKIPHLSYIGDATIGENANLGAGTTTANYDGKNKHQTVIGNNVKTGVNTVLVAPVSLGDGAYTGAGAVVVKDVPSGALAKGVPATNDDDWIAPSDR
ncbi:MAG: bifunctional UDP-N-acetylglucosamine diphosphorylase/glucosamine-1-phosphate N-acetyltransferase GlmU [Acidimicrobiia bacterium]